MFPGSTFKNRIRTPRRPPVLLCLFLLSALGVAGGWTLWTLTARYRGVIYTDPAAVPERPVALVFGAGYWPDGTPSDILRDRVAAAVELYRAGRVRKLLSFREESHE